MTLNGVIVLILLSFVIILLSNH